MRRKAAVWKAREPRYKGRWFAFPNSTGHSGRWFATWTEAMRFALGGAQTVRVRHMGHKWPQAYAEGTATVEAWESNGQKGDVQVRLDNGIRTTWPARLTVEVKPEGQDR